MSIDFRCEHCGKLLSAQGTEGASMRCPHCSEVVEIPAGLAALPRPIVPPNIKRSTQRPESPAQRPDAPPTAAPAKQHHFTHSEEAAAGILAVIMPWVISIFLHLGVVLIAWFGTVLVTAAKAVPDDVIIPDVEYVDNPGTLNQGGGSSGSNNAQANSLTRAEYARNESPADTGITKNRVPITVAGAAGASAGGGESGGLGLGGGNGAGNGPRTGLFGHGGNAHHVVYVIDRSGSMKELFDFVQFEMRDSIRKLKPIQDFHMIFFSQGKPTESPPFQLVPATEEYKQAASEFLGGVSLLSSDGRTYAAEAMTRAFDVLEKADAGKKGKLLFLLTDGDFVDNPEILKIIKERNANKEVHIITFLYGTRSPEAAKFLKQVSEDNGGTFHFVSIDE